MKKSYKIIGAVAAILILIIVILLFKADDYVEAKVVEGIEKFPKHITLEYDSMDFNSLQGNLIFKNSKIKFRDPQTDSLISTILIEDISILDIGYWEYIQNKNFIIQRLELIQPKITHRVLKVENDSMPKDSTEKDPWKNMLKIENFVITDAFVEVKDFETDSLIFTTNRSNVEINEVLIDSTVGDLIPFKYDSYRGEFNDITYKIGEYENAKVNRARFLPNDIALSNVSLKTKYDRGSYDRMLSVERDWYDIEIDSIRLSNSEFGKVNDSINSFKSDSTVVYHPKVNIYRNKLLPDENEIKPFYSDVLRNLAFDLTLNKIVLENGNVSYEEKVIATHAPGKLDFSEFYASIYNFSNTYAEGKQTTIDIKTNFMTTTPLTVKWTFDFNDQNDDYNFEGNLGSLDTQVLNQFTNRNLNVMLEGLLHKTYFNINGNNFNSQIDIRINYDDFRINLINDKRNKPKKLLNAIVNIFVRKDSDKAEGNFREGSETIERNKFGSFYNNLWLNLQGGLKNAITGDVKNKKE